MVLRAGFSYRSAHVLSPYFGGFVFLEFLEKFLGQLVSYSVPPLLGAVVGVLVPLWVGVTFVVIRWVLLSEGTGAA